MKIIDKGIVYDFSGDNDRKSNFIPSITAAKNGRWVASMRSAPVKMDAPYMFGSRFISDDKGRSWQGPFTFDNPPDIDGKPHQILGGYLKALDDGKIIAHLNAIDCSDTSLPVFNPQTEGVKKLYVLSCESTDGGKTFGEYSVLDLSSVSGAAGLSGAPLVLKSGEIACQFEVHKGYYDTSDKLPVSMISISGELGKSYGEPVPVAIPGDKVFWDQRMEVLDDGRILDLFWTLDLKKSSYTTIHACESLDNGRTWSKTWDTRIPGQPGNPVSLPDGRVLAVSINREQSPKILLYTSEDNGRTFDIDNPFVVYDSRLNAQNIKDPGIVEAWAELKLFSVGHPFLYNLSDNEVLAYYYCGGQTNSTNIHWVRIGTD